MYPKKINKSNDGKTFYVFLQGKKKEENIKLI